MTRSISWLDFKLGFRMLGRYPGITGVGVLAIAVAIALGTLYFEALDKWKNPRLPVTDAGRVVSVRLWDAEATSPEPRLLHDFAAWRAQARTVQQLGAAVPFVRNLITADGQVVPVKGSEVTANAFTLMGVRPLLGRVLTAQDEQPGEPPVVVLSHALWQSRFAGDASVIGATVELGTTAATVVGVMPAGYGFPVNERIWTPLREDGALRQPLSGPITSVFGRLADGATKEQAQAELAGITARHAALDPEAYRHLRPRVTGYAEPLHGGQQAMVMRAMLSIVAGIFFALLAIVCTNVATLVFARTATRSWEITVRSALGASRRRVIAQLFAEALVLTGVAAVLGLVIARTALQWGLTRLDGSDALPFWIDASISWRTILWTALLTLFGAAIVGVLPALRATRLNVQDALRGAAAAKSGLKFGGFWTTVIVVQVAITVALLPIAAAGVSESNRFLRRAEGIGAERFLAADIGIDREDWGGDSAAFAGRARLSVAQLAARLRAEPGIEAVAFADRVPVEDQFKYKIAVDSAAGAPANTLRTSTLVHVSDGFFDAFGTEVVAGRDFAALDFEERRVLIVNQSFVRHVFNGRNAIGQRIQVVDGEVSAVGGKQWYEIVGVVRDFGWQLPAPHEQSAMYFPSQPVTGRAGTLVVRAGDPDAVAARLRQVAAEVDPTIRLTDVQPLARVGGGEAEMNWVLTSVAWLVSLLVLVLSAMGIHALLSFTVSRRTREIGIRAALGADTGRIVTSVFARAALQVVAGIMLGSGLAALIGFNSGSGILLLLAAAAVMLTVALIACVVPLRRALRIQPTEALRAEA